MLKLILSDIDGTLLPFDRQALSGELFELIRAFHRRGVAFCPSSGRQYSSLHRLFEPVEDLVYFMCENGGGLYHQGRTLSTRPLPRALAEEMLRLVYPVAPALFEKAGPGCVAGPCPEGKMCCGETEAVRARYKALKGEEDQ